MNELTWPEMKMTWTELMNWTERFWTEGEMNWNGVTEMDWRLAELNRGNGFNWTNRTELGVNWMEKQKLTELDCDWNEIIELNWRFELNCEIELKL